MLNIMHLRGEKHIYGINHSTASYFAHDIPHGSLQHPLNKPINYIKNPRISQTSSTIIAGQVSRGEGGREGEREGEGMGEGMVEREGRGDGREGEGVRGEGETEGNNVFSKTKLKT